MQGHFEMRTLVTCSQNHHSSRRDSMWHRTDTILTSCILITGRGVEIVFNIGKAFYI